MTCFVEHVVARVSERVRANWYAEVGLMLDAFGAADELDPLMLAPEPSTGSLSPNYDFYKQSERKSSRFGSFPAKLAAADQLDLH